MLDKTWLENLILDEEKNRQIVEFVRMIEEPLSTKNKNYTSVISRIVATVKLGSGDLSTVSFIAKRIPDSEGMKQFYEEFRVEDEEVSAYGNLDRMDELMAENEDHRERLWGRLKGRTEAVLLFEDLTAKGYKPYPTDKLYDQKHSEFALRELARYHAMGIALLKNHTVNPKKMKPLYIFDQNARDKFFKRGLVSLKDAVKNWGPEWSESLKQLNHMVDDFDQVVRLCDKIKETTLNVIIHGDFWKGNMLFKHGVHNEILSMKFVDFQVVSHYSYVYDLIVILQSSIDPDLRLHHYDRLLDAYRESLVANMKFYQLDWTKAPSLEEMKATLKTLQPLVVVLATMYWPVISNESDIDLKDVYEKEMDLLKPEMFTSDKCKRILGREIRQLEILSD